jgi:hypothetical protein
MIMNTQFWLERPQGKEPLGERREDNIRKDLLHTECQDSNWNDLA